MRASFSSVVLLSVVVVGIAGCREPESMPAVQAPAAAATAPNTANGGPVLRVLDATAIATELKPSSLCNLEHLGDQAFAGNDLATRGVAKLAGWIGAEDTRQPPANAAVRFESNDKTRAWEAPLALGVKREDVVNALSEPGLVNAGFSQEIPLTGLPTGRYHLYLSYSSGSEHYACDNGRHISVE